MMISVAHLVNLYGVDGYLSPFAAILGHEFGMACEAKCEK